MKLLLISIISVILVVSCIPSQAITPPTQNATPIKQKETPMQDNTPIQGGGLAPIYAPRAGDDALQRSKAYIDSANVSALESAPPQFSVTLIGGLPTPCHELRVVFKQPITENKILLEAYSVVDPKAICAQMIKPFEQTIYLGSFPNGHYTVWVNGIQAGQFDA